MFYLLITTIPTLKKSNTFSIYVGIGLFIAFIIFIILSGKSSASSSSRSGSRRSSRSAGGKYNKRTFRHRAAAMGFTKPEIRTLEYLIKLYKVRSPYNLLRNTETLNSTLRKALLRIEEDIASKDVKEGQKLILYRIKQKVELNSEKKEIMAGTKQLKPGQKLHISTPGGVRYPSMVTSNLNNYLGTRIPSDEHGNQIRWRKGTKVLVFFWKSNGQGYSFESKVSGYNNIRGVPSLFLNHSKSIHQAQQRRFRRKQLGKPAYMYAIRIITTGFGKNQQRKAVVDTKSGALATILEVSAGGCSLRSTYPLGPGELMKLEFETFHGQKIVAFGKVKSTSKLHPVGGIMHVMFTKVSRDNINKINAFIYDFSSSNKSSRF